MGKIRVNTWKNSSNVVWFCQFWQGSWYVQGGSPHEASVQPYRATRVPSVGMGLTFQQLDNGIWFSPYTHKSDTLTFVFFSLYCSWAPFSIIHLLINQDGPLCVMSILSAHLCISYLWAKANLKLLLTYTYIF